MEAKPDAQPAADDVLLDALNSVPLEEEVGKSVSFSELFKFAKGYDFALLMLGIVAAMGVGMALPIFSLLFGELVEEGNSLNTDSIGDRVGDLGEWMFIAGGLVFAAGFIMSACFSLSSDNQVHRIKTAYFDAILRQESAWFDLHKTGSITSRLHGNTEIIKQGLSERASFFFYHLFTIIASFSISFVKCWRLTLVLLAMAPLTGLSAVAMFYALTAMGKKNSAAYANAGAIAEEVLSSVRTVHSLSAHRRFEGAYHAEIDGACAASRFAGFVSGAGIGSAFFCMFCTYALGLWYSSFLVDWELSTISEVLTAFIAVLFASVSFGQIIPPITSFAQAQQAAHSIFRVIDREPRVEQGTRKLPELKANIRFNRVTFRYPTRMHRPVIREFSLEIPAGETVAFVGLSGCGKSSLVSLIQRFYEPAAGYFGVRGPGGSFVPLPYEANAVLLEKLRMGGGGAGCPQTVDVTLPISLAATCSKTMAVRLAGTGALSRTVQGSDGPIRWDGGKWYWIERRAAKPGLSACCGPKGSATKSNSDPFAEFEEEPAGDLEFAFPDRVSALLSEAETAGRPFVEVDLAFGRYKIDMYKRTRTNVEQPVEYQKNGAITVDGERLGSLDIGWWRDNIGMVTQEPVLFSGTVFDNIRMGRKEATREEVVEACEQAHIHSVIERWPDAYETKVGEGGCQLSGGQKQRIAIARAIIKRPKILILDEATSALDRESEVKVQKALQSIMNSDNGKVTTIVIAHRLQTVMHADRIVVMQPPSSENDDEGGKIVETGRHAELLANEGYYAKLWNSQNRTTDSRADDASGEAVQSAAADLEAPVQTKTADELEEEQKKQMEEKIKNKTSFLRIARLAAPWNSWLVPGIAGALLTGAVYPVFALVFSEALDILGSMNYKVTDRSDIDKYAVYMLFVAVGAWFGHVLLNGGFGYVGTQLTCRIRKMLFSHYLSQDVAFFDAPGHETGELTTVLSGKAQVIHGLFGLNIGMLLRVLVALGLGFTMAFVRSWRVTLMVLTAVPVLIVTGWLSVAIAASGFGSKGSSTSVVARESIANVKTVVSLNTQADAVASFAAASSAALKKQYRNAFAYALTFGMGQFAIFAVFGIGFLYGGKLISDGTDDFSSIQAAVIQVVMASLGIGEAAGMQASAANAKEAAAVVFETLDTKPSLDQMSERGRSDGVTRGVVEFSDVTFAYPARPNVDVLKRFSLKIAPAGGRQGTQIGLIGSTGSGKSTTLQLLERLYSLSQCGSGSVTVDGIDIAELSLGYWRSMVGVVSQEPVLFDMSVLENVRLGKPNATLEEVIEACELAHIADDITRLPQGYNTKVGARGSMLSGGQKQRVAIARAVVKKPKFLLLDEATSALDNASERLVQRALDHVIETQSMTTITVAHKLTTIENADVITVLDRGVIIEQGSHEQLMKIESGDYKDRYLLYHSL
ncbi:Multidrug resistance protein 1 [Diplonema papillatum]|nr:Multidrug resistance protein 1 [Diplonema papillatum]